MSKVSARLVLRMMTDAQKRTLLDMYRYLLSRYEDDPGNFFKRDVTQDETWVHHFDTESKMQSKQWKQPDPPLLRSLRGALGNLVVCGSCCFCSEKLTRHSDVQVGVQNC